jgi:hypothetical protein
MSTFANASIQANGVWNTVTAAWNTTPLYWSYLAPKRKGESGDADIDLLDEEDLLYEVHNPYKKRSKEKFVKIFMTAHNQFLTEDQRRNMRIAGIYPTYGAKFKMKKENGLLNENQRSEKVDVKAVNVKIGLEII